MLAHKQVYINSVTNYKLSRYYIGPWQLHNFLMLIHHLPNKHLINFQRLCSNSKQIQDPVSQYIFGSTNQFGSRRYARSTNSYQNQLLSCLWRRYQQCLGTIPMLLIAKNVLQSIPMFLEFTFSFFQKYYISKFFQNIVIKQLQ